MTSDTVVPPYNEMTGLLDRADIGAVPSEIHGLISGVLVLPDAEQINWLDLILATENLQPEDLDSGLSQALQSLYRQTVHRLSDRDFGYTLYLPDPDQKIAERTQALAAWCRGFLLGISATGLTLENSSDLVRESLRDIVELSSVEAESGDAGEERAFLEIEEYLRVAVQLVKEELQPVTG
jgi:yecA family protein